MSSGNVGYAYSPELIRLADLLPSNKGRASRVHALIEGFQLVERCEVLDVHPCTKADLTKYHDEGFIDFVLSDTYDESIQDDVNDTDNSEDASDVDSDGELATSKSAKYGLQYDCYAFEGLSDYIRLVAGATLACAEYLTADVPGRHVAINWTGGRHHAKRAKASGFCYINDVVLGIQLLRTKFSKILYVDLDLHHGDGVEEAFAYSSKVHCLSVHRYGRGFFPGTGSIKSAKSTASKRVTNIPTKRGLSNDSFLRIFREIIVPQKDKFGPDAVVVTCGADGLARDEHGEWNLSISAFDDVLTSIVDWNLPLLLLGGGGYHTYDTARCWAMSTAAVLQDSRRKGWTDVPDHEFSPEYLDDACLFQVDDHQRRMLDENTPEYIAKLKAAIGLP